MPLPLIAAVPVVHSSGAWIASTAASGYISGTLSSTWIGAFIAGNSGVLSSLGLVSAAGVFGSTGVLSGIGSSAAAGLGAAMTTVGLGDLAIKFGLAPKLFLGLTPAGWAIAGASTVATGAITAFLTARTMKKINEERVKGGLEKISALEIVNQVLTAEKKAKLELLEGLSDRFDIKIIDNGKRVVIDGHSYLIKKLLYVVNKDGSEQVVLSRIGRKNLVICQVVDPHELGEPNPAV